MHRCMPARLWRVVSPRRHVALVLAGASLAVAIPASLAAQAAPPARRDSTVRTDSAQRIDRVLVSAIRASDAAPIAQKTISRDVITERHFGQDVPLLLQGASPSLTAHTETGTSWGYSYLRLRGIDQTRINITIDGVPLNDMEDQVLYFANFADLMGNVQTVQVQRGVGTSTAGTASFAGSVNFETAPVPLKDASGDVSLQLGSFGAQRLSGTFRSGLTDSRLAVYGRASALRTNGYRDHAGVEGRSAFVSAGWFGDRTIVKATALAGLLEDTLSYVGATLDELRANRRFNPLSPDERDKFGQQMLALSVSHAVSDATTVNTTVYRNSASGNYDYFYLPDRYRYSLDHTWYGVTSAVNVQRATTQFSAGINANTYARAHRAYLQPDPAPLYDNTGHKQDASAFAKVSIDQGRLRWFADLQGRWAKFRYEPDANAGIGEAVGRLAVLQPEAGRDGAPGRCMERLRLVRPDRTRAGAQRPVRRRGRSQRRQRGRLRRLHAHQAGVGAGRRSGRHVVGRGAIAAGQRLQHGVPEQHRPHRSANGVGVHAAAQCRVELPSRRRAGRHLAAFAPCADRGQCGLERQSHPRVHGLLQRDAGGPDERGADADAPLPDGGAGGTDGVEGAHALPWRGATSPGRSSTTPAGRIGCSPISSSSTPRRGPPGAGTR